MPSLSDLKQRMIQIQEAVKSKLPDIAITLAITGKAIAERNIRQKGFGVKYSENKIPAWFLHGKELNAAGTTFLQNHGVNEKGEQGEGKKKRKKKGETADAGQYDTFTNWGEFRKAQGLEADHVDLGYTNKMWADMAPVEVKQEESGRVVAYLGARTKENQDKMNYNRDRYGDFVSKGLGEAGQKTLQQVALDEVNAIIEQFQIE